MLYRARTGAAYPAARLPLLTGRNTKPGLMIDNKAAHKILRVLILDDSPDDAEQASAALRQTGYMLKTQRLETGVAVEQTLDANPWDLVLCAHGLAGLPARQVVELVTRKQAFTPVIVLARRVSDEELGELIHAGARDVIVKGQWGRLAPVVERELAVAADRRTFEETREAMRSLEARYRSMIESSIEAISYVQDGMHMDANPAYLRLFGYDSLDALKETPLLNLIDKADQARFKQALKKPAGGEQTQEFQAVTADGSRISIEVALNPLVISDEPCVQVVANDISKRKALETKLQSMHQRDPLTGLYNRGYFLSTLDDSLKTPGSVVIGLHIQGLAECNQRYGHTACDRMLVQLTRQLRELSGSHVAARVAGGQFAILLEAKGAAGADALAARLRDMVAGLHIGDAAHNVKPPIDILTCKLDGTHADRQAVLDATFRTDTVAAVPALAAASVRPTAAPSPAAAAPPKATPAAPPAATRPVAAPPPVADLPSVPATPKTRLPIPPPSANLPSLTPTPPAPPAAVPAAHPVAPIPSGLREALAQALGGNRMELLFQPIINLHGEPHCFYQAQLVLPTADGRLAPAREYMPIAETAGLSGKVDRTMLLNVIDTLSKYHLEGRRGIVFAGLSAGIVQDNALLAAIQMHLKATGLDPSRLILEIDEPALAKDLAACQAFAEKATSMGLGIGVQHFTNRAVSMEVLSALPFQYFSVDCGPEMLDEEALYGAIDAVHAIDRQIIARGLEDANLFTTLFSRGVHYVQGDYLQVATTGLDYSFEAEQTLASDEPPSSGTWRVAG